MSRRRRNGFTLVEMVVAITVAAIVVGFMAMFMTAPMNSYMQQRQRAELVDSANSAMRMISNDVRRALPASVRMFNSGTNRAMELLYADVARYRAGSGGTDLDRVGDTTFTALGCFLNTPVGNAPNTSFLVVGHGIGAGNAYTHAGVTTTAATVIRVDPATAGPDPCPGGEQTITTSANFSFPIDSPTRSVYLVSEPVSYVCNLTARTLRRFSGYTMAANHAARATEAQLIAAGATSVSLVARDVTACTFAVTPETNFVGGLVRVQITFARNGETFTAFDQVQVENRR